MLQNEQHIPLIKTKQLTCLQTYGMYMCVQVLNGPAGHQAVQEEHPFPALTWRSSDF